MSKSRTVCSNVFTPTASMNPMGAQSSTTVWMLRDREDRKKREEEGRDGKGSVRFRWERVWEKWEEGEWR